MNTPEYLLSERGAIVATAAVIGGLLVRIFAREARIDRLYEDYNKHDYGMRNEQVVDIVKQNNGSTEGWEFYKTENGEGVRRVQ